MSASDEGLAQTFWLVTVVDKEVSGEPDVGLAVSLGPAVDAETLGQAMVDALAAAGHGRCVYRARELEIGRPYRASALIATARSEAWRRVALAESDRYVSEVSAARVAQATRAMPTRQLATPATESGAKSRAFCVKCGVQVEVVESGCPICHFDTVTTATTEVT